MKRGWNLLVGASLVAATLVIPPAASADEATFVATSFRWGGPITKGDPVVSSPLKRRLIAAYGSRLLPLIHCTGTECDPARPARIEILKKGAWVPWASGTLGELTESQKALTSKKTLTVLMRSTLPAYGALPAVTTPRWNVRFLPGTSVKLSGPTVIPASKANDFTWQFRAGPGSITVGISPAEAGRIVELRDSLVEGWPLIARTTTDASGRATLTADVTDVRSLHIIVLPSRARAGWNVYASPVVNSGT